MQSEKIKIMQIATTNGVNMTGTVKEMQNTQAKAQLPKNCVPFGLFKKEFFKRLKKRYEKIPVDHS
ncbi:MAG: hypothetical protein II817_01520 [Bacteroidales bacterium]|nr:hypothetical protein [Bacteroidales bacterium]